MDLVWYRNIIKNLGDFAVIIYSTLSAFFWHHKTDFGGLTKSKEQNNKFRTALKQ